MQNNKKKVDNICVLRTSSLGDICHMLPFIYTLKSEYPKAKISWIIGKDEVNFIDKISGVEFIVFDKNKTIENYGFKLESSYKIDQDIKQTFIRNEKK